MLRLLVLLLVLVNAAYFAFTHDLLRPYGLAPLSQREPQRVTQQVRPELVRILSADEVRSGDAQAATRPAECLQAGVLDEAQAAAVRQAAQDQLPAGSWLIEDVVQPSRWIIYMGRYADAQAMAKKRTELAALDLRFEPVTKPPLGYGLSLGGFDNEAAARAELAKLNQRGVRTATVVQERAEVRGAVFKVPLADAALRGLLEGLKPTLTGHPLGACS